MNFRILCIATGLLLVHSAANAWFFFIPTGAIQNAVQGAHCVPATAKPGDKINVGGKFWTVVENNGSSIRCNQYPAFPNIAKLEPYYSNEELKASISACLPMGAAVGQRTSIPIVGEVEIQSITNEGCSDSSKPISVRVVRVRGAELLKQEARTAPTPVSAPQPPTAPLTDSQACVPLGTGQGDTIQRYGADFRVTRILKNAPPCSEPWPVIADVEKVPAVAKITTVERLRELKKLREEDLITDAVYESKQREILSGQ